MFGHVIAWGHMIMLGHVIGHMMLKLVRDHVMSHVIVFQGHMPLSQDPMGESSSSLSGYS